ANVLLSEQEQSLVMDCIHSAKIITQLAENMMAHWTPLDTKGYVKSRYIYMAGLVEFAIAYKLGSVDEHSEFMANMAVKERALDIVGGIPSSLALQHLQRTNPVELL
ncbi:hypothetical protein HDU91_000722, partial [Kappamyces sp. JEL0680]